MTTRTAALLLLGVVCCLGAAGKEDAKPAERAACMHCGATCGLTPICVCERGTKKRTKTEFETVCEPLCVPGCGSKPWCFGDRAATGCTDCCEEECRCPGRVRSCKRLKKKTVDEEVPKITRRVAYVCDCCAGRSGPGCCGGGYADHMTAWWRRMTWWWPR